MNIKAVFYSHRIDKKIDAKRGMIMREKKRKRQEKKRAPDERAKTL